MNRLEDLKTSRLLLEQLDTDLGRMVQRLPSGSDERYAVVKAYSELQKALVLVMIQIRELEVQS